MRFRLETLLWKQIFPAFSIITMTFFFPSDLAAEFQWNHIGSLLQVKLFLDREITQFRMNSFQDSGAEITK